MLGATFATRCEKARASERVHDICTRSVEGGRATIEIPGRHSLAGRTGRGSKPPPQFGHTFKSTCCTQSAQNVHSKLQMRASVEDGGKSLSQHSQFGRSVNAMYSLQSWPRPGDT